MLKEKVEGLAGEVEVLKGIVEEGLKERGMLREQTTATADDNEGTGPTSRDVLGSPDQQSPREESEESSEESKDESVEGSISAS